MKEKKIQNESGILEHWANRWNLLGEVKTFPLNIRLLKLKKATWVQDKDDFT